MARTLRLGNGWRWLRNHKRDLEVIAILAAILSPFAVLWLNKTFSDNASAMQRDFASTQLLDSFFGGIEELALSRDEKKDLIVIARAQRVIRGLKSPKHSAAVLRFISDVGRSDLFEKARVKSKTVHGFHSQFLDLQNIDLHGQNLSTIILANAFLPFSDLRGVSMRSANLWQSILWRSDLTNAQLFDANLDDADMREADLTNASLRDASLRRARFDEANLHGTTLDGADLQDARLENARNLTVTQLSKAKTLYRAGLPAELASELRVKHPRLITDKPPDADLLWKKRPDH